MSSWTETSLNGRVPWAGLYFPTRGVMEILNCIVEVVATSTSYYLTPKFLMESSTRLETSFVLKEYAGAISSCIPTGLVIRILNSFAEALANVAWCCVITRRLLKSISTFWTNWKEFNGWFSFRHSIIMILANLKCTREAVWGLTRCYVLCSSQFMSTTIIETSLDWQQTGVSFQLFFCAFAKKVLLCYLSLRNKRKLMIRFGASLRDCDDGICLWNLAPWIITSINVIGEAAPSFTFHFCHRRVGSSGAPS